MNVKINYLIYLFCILCVGCKEEFPPPASGNYGSHMILACEPIGNLVTGVYEENEDCRFFFTGKVIGNKVNVIRWPYGMRDKDNTYGVLELTGPNAFKLYFNDPVSGCNGGKNFTSETTTYKLTEKVVCNFIRTVNSPYTIVYETNDTSSVILDTLYQNHVLKVIKNRKGFAEIYFESSNSRLGWIPQRDMRRFPG